MMVYIEALKSGNANKIISATKKYADALSKLNEVNEETLSDADMDYYLDVTNRVNQQLLLSQ